MSAREQLIPSASLAEYMNETGTPELEKIMLEGDLQTADGTTLKYRVYEPEKIERRVVVVHGYTEGMQKYDELALYLARSGCAVYIYDQRGHGRSSRQVSDLTLTHVDRFGKYVSDLDEFIEKVIPKDLPVFLFAHSMGGAVSALYLESHQGKIAGAVMSSPMIAPSTGAYPAFVGRLICRVMILFGQAKKRIFLSGEYPGEEKFENACSSCEDRFRRYEYFKRTHTDYQNYSCTYRWTLESLLVSRKILKKGAPERIDCPVTVAVAGLDTVVRTDAEEAFASRVAKGRKEFFPNSKHELVYACDEDLGRLLGLCDETFASVSV